jgi:hypothetical protein
MALLEVFFDKSQNCFMGCFYLLLEILYTKFK